MKIRHAEAEDVDRIQEVAMTSWQDTYSSIISEEDVRNIVEDWYSRKDLLQQVEDPIFFVAELDGVLAGYIHASVRNGKAHLHRLYVRPESQGEGLGSALYEKAEDLIREEADSIELEVMSENGKGLGFYLHQGFEEVKEESVDLIGTEIRQKILVKKL